MKRFLSILLALAVGFTFTFGSAMSAFAADTHVVTASELNAGYSAAQNALTEKDAEIYTEYTGTKATYADVEGLYKLVDGEYVLTDALNDATPAGNYYVKTSYAVPLSVWKDALKKAYDDTMAKVVASTYKTEATAKDYVTLEVRDDLLDLTYGGTSKYAGYAAATQFDSEIAKIAAKMEACDTSIYSAKTYTNADITVAPMNAFLWIVDGETYYVAQEAAKAQVALDVKNFNKTYLEKYKAVVAGTLNDAVTLNAVMGQYEAAAAYLNDDGEYELDENFLTTAKEISIEASVNADIATGISVLENDIATYLNDGKTEKYSTFTSKTKTKKSEVDEAIAAYRTGKTWLNNNGTIYQVTDINYAKMSPFVASVAKVTKWNAKAEELKAKKNDDGTAMYDAKVVDDALFNATNAEYSDAHNGVFAPAPLTYLTTVEKTDYKAVVVIDDTTSEDITSVTVAATIDNEANIAKTAFYSLEWATVQTAIDTYIAAVDAANTATEVKKAQAALKTAIGKVKKQTEIEALYKDAGALNDTFDKERTALVNYYKYFVTLNPTETYVPVFTDVTVEKTGNEAVANIADGDLAYWYIVKGARTIDEVKALADEAKAAVGAAKTTTELKAEAQKVIDMIAALPAIVTLDNKAAVADAVKAYDDLDDAYDDYVSNIDTLKKAVKTLQVAEYTAVDAAAKALPDVAKTTVADKKAVNDAYDAAKAYNETEMYLTAKNMTETKLYTTNTIVTKVKAVQALELEALGAAVEKLPAAGKVTVDSAAVIKAARTAYDAYVADYVTNYDAEKHNAYNLAVLKGYETAIAAAEVELAAEEEANKYNDTDAKAFLQDATVKASSTVKNGKVTVTANADVQELLDNGYTVEFKFYKSTKKSSGYKATVTKNATESKTYTNTKPAKGANYYKYIIIVTDAEGNVVTKTALKDCSYAKRTIK